MKGGKRRNHGVQETIPIRSQFQHLVSQSTESPLEITLEIVHRALGVIRRPLKAVHGSTMKLLHCPGAYPFRFNLVIPDPRPDDLQGTSEMARISRDSRDAVGALMCDLSYIVSPSLVNN